MNKKALVGIILVVVVVVAAGAIVLGNRKSKDASTVDTVTSQPATSDSMSNMPPTSDSSIPPTPNTAPSSDSPASNASAVTINNFAFGPQNITVKAGTTVTWTNKDSASHTVTADQASADAPASQNLAQGQTYSFTFKKAGTYAYHCQIHPSMKGTVTVTE